MRIKVQPPEKRVRLKGLATEMVIVALVVAGEFEKFGGEAVITSATDGDHMAGSKHHCGEALDFRLWSVHESRHEAMVGSIQDALGPDYIVLLEPNHIHVQTGG